MSKKAHVPVLGEFVDFCHGSGVRHDMAVFDKSVTRQEFAEECDINTIMARYEQSGAFSHVNLAMPRYMDVTELPNLQGSLDVFRQASEAFYSLPAKVRKEFDNDPVAFVEYAQNAENLDKMREWGLAPPAPVPAPPVEVKIVGEPAPPKAP